jgi:hypothetical protein
METLKIFLISYRKVFFILGLIPTAAIVFFMYKNNFFPQILVPYFRSIQTILLRFQIVNFVLYLISHFIVKIK